MKRIVATVVLIFIRCAFRAIISYIGSTAIYRDEKELTSMQYNREL